MKTGSYKNDKKRIEEDIKRKFADIKNLKAEIADLKTQDRFQRLGTPYYNNRSR